MSNRFFPLRRLRRFALWLLIDAVTIFLAFSIAYWGRAIFSPLDFLQDVTFILLSIAVFIPALYLSGVYNRLWSQHSGHSVVVIFRAVVVAVALLAIVNFLPGNRLLPASTFLMGSLLSFIGMVATRYRSRLLSAFSWRWNAVVLRRFPRKRTRVLIVGAGESGQTLAWRLKHRFQDNNYLLVGFVDDDDLKQGMYVEGSQIIGKRQDIPSLVEKREIDMIVVAIHNISGPDFREVLAYCEQTLALIKVAPDMLALINARHSTTMLRDVQPEDLIGRSVVEHHEAVDLSPVQNRVVLVTGAAGSIGSELSRQMVMHQPVKLVLLDNNESDLHDLVVELRSKHPQYEIEPVLVDVSDQVALSHVFETHHPQIIFHAAAYKHVPMLERYPQQAVRVNVNGTRYLAELAMQYQLERFVLISTDKAVNPSSVMGASKRLCELIIHAYSQKQPTTLFTAVRFGNVLGSRGSVVPTFNRQIDVGGPITVTHEEMTRYFMSVTEAVNLVIHAACITRGDDIFVLRMGEVVRILDIAERMIRLRGLRPYEDIPINFIGVRAGEKMHEELHDGDEKPENTIHPGIFKLSSWRSKMPIDVFFDRLMDLSENGLNTYETPLLQLRRLAEEDEDEPKSQHA